MDVRGDFLGPPHGTTTRTLKSVFLFSGDTEIFITYISYLGLATDQFMEIHNILSLYYGGYNMPYLKKLHFYGIQVCLFASALRKTQFLTAKQE